MNNTYPNDCKETQKNNFSKRLTLVCLCGIASALLIHILSFLTVLSGISKTNTGYYISLIAVSFLAILLPAVIFSRESGGIKKAVAGNKNKTNIAYSTLLFISGLSGCILINFVVTIISAFFPTVLRQSAPIYTTDIYTFIMTILSMAAAPAIFEETAYRGFTLSVLKKDGYIYSMIISSVIFGMLHSNISTALFASLSGIIFAYVRIHSGTIILPIAIHFVHNTLAVIGNTAMKTLKDEQFTQIYFEVLIFSAIIFVICLPVLKRQNILKNKTACLTDEIPTSKKILYTLTCPAFIAFIIITLILKYL